jgi:hypothetical protein
VVLRLFKLEWKHRHFLFTDGHKMLCLVSYKVYEKEEHMIHLGDIFLCLFKFPVLNASMTKIYFYLNVKYIDQKLQYDKINLFYLFALNS